MAVSLPPPRQQGTVSVEECLARRRSVRRYAPDPLSLEQFSQLLWAAQGLTYHRFRTAPSAGASYPLEVFAVVGRGAVAGLEGGVYRYRAEDHSVEMHREGAAGVTAQSMGARRLFAGFQRVLDNLQQHCYHWLNCGGGEECLPQKLIWEIPV